MKTLIALAAATAALLSLAPAAQAASYPVKSAGLGGQTTDCTLTVNNKDYIFTTAWLGTGSTTCDQPVQQACAGQYRSAPADPGAGTVGAQCSVRTEALGLDGGIYYYRARIAAPAGQLWVVAPPGCSGLATAALDCTISARGVPG
jgi:hypothetical protein